MTAGTGLRLGILIQGWHVWHGSLVYVENMLAAIASMPAAQRPRVKLVATTRHEAFSALLLHRHLELAEELLVVDTLDFQRGGLRTVASREELARHIDCLLPAINLFPNLPVLNWIPDFQDRHLPQFFSVEELAQRRQWQDDLVDSARLILLSSEDATTDLRRLYPQAATKARILRFCTVPDPAWYAADAHEVAARYGITEPYLICCNQFWAHKNHGVLFQALGQCAQAGFSPRLVCTGLNVDHRNEAYYAGLMATAKDMGIADRTSCLGFINREDQVQLIRGAMAMIQPSLFEGWSTVVEDARALGKRIFLSSIGVHREQAPARGIFFDPLDAAQLAQQLLTCRSELEREPDPAAEAQARQQAGQRIRDYVDTLYAIAAECAASSTGPRQVDVPPPPLDRARLICALTSYQEVLGQQADMARERVASLETSIRQLEAVVHQQDERLHGLTVELDAALKPRMDVGRCLRRRLGFAKG